MRAEGWSVTKKFILIYILLLIQIKNQEIFGEIHETLWFLNKLEVVNGSIKIFAKKEEMKDLRQKRKRTIETATDTNRHD